MEATLESDFEKKGELDSVEGQSEEVKSCNLVMKNKEIALWGASRERVQTPSKSDKTKRNVGEFAHRR